MLESVIDDFLGRACSLIVFYKDIWHHLLTGSAEATSEVVRLHLYNGYRHLLKVRIVREPRIVILWPLLRIQPVNEDIDYDAIAL